jgi:hypothetical protein
MTKKSFAVFFLILAGIILLGHAVVPHHHHLLFGFPGNEFVNHNHNTKSPATHSHEHEGSSTTNFLLDQFVIVPQNNSQITPHSTLVSKFYGVQDFHLLIPACLTDTLNVNICESRVRHSFYHQKSFNYCSCAGILLRGPPVA